MGANETGTGGCTGMPREEVRAQRAELVAAPGPGPDVPTARRTAALVGRAAGRAGRLSRRLVGRARTGVHDAGMATAEYAIATLAAVGFAGLLVVILRSDEVRSLLLGIVRRALSS